MPISIAYIEGQRVHISEYEDSMKGKVQCADGHDVIAKRGAKKQHHYAHKAGTVCDADRDMSDWHCWMQGRIKHECLEVRHVKDGKLHIADAKTGWGVIEFQKSVIPAETIKERETFYKQYGNFTWVFYLGQHNVQVEDGPSPLVRVSGGSRFFTEAQTPYYIDLGRRSLLRVIGMKGKLLKCERVHLKQWDEIHLGDARRDGADRRLDVPDL